uniref:Maturase K n=1 Tax=Callistopteris apiifolia TaxID=221309 RepID=A0A385KP96_9MONI|nr:maturase K [Callistopteris apiifolia]
MRTGYRFLSKFRRLRERKKIDARWDYLLYCLLLQDDLYLIASNRSSNRLGIDSIDQANLSKEYNILSIKRIINGIRQQDLSGIFSTESDPIRLGDSRYMSFNTLSKGICSVLKMILSSQIEPLFVREVSKWKSSGSKHSVFPFMEDKLLHSSYVLETKIPHTLHSEIFIRMFRRRIKDTPFLHLSRLIFHMYTNPESLIDYSLTENNNSLAVLVWNSYMYEIELLVLPLWEQFSYLRLRYLIDIFDHNNILQKQNQVRRYLLIQLEDYSYLTRNLCVHYGRYENHCLLILRGTKNSAKRWIYYILKFTEFHSHRWLHYYRICLRRLSKNCVLFLGYLLGIQLRINEVRVGTTRDSYITVSIFNYSFFQVPILSLIKSMARGSFCDNSGRLVSRSAWTTLTDDEILIRFVRIWKILSVYYSGSINKYSLYRLRYILQTSCTKTLACKHKSTIRIIRQRFDLRIFLKTFSFSGGSTLSPFFESNDILKNQRFWYLEITQFSLLYSI